MHKKIIFEKYTRIGLARVKSNMSELSVNTPQIYSLMRKSFPSLGNEHNFHKRVSKQFTRTAETGVKLFQARKQLE